MVIKLEENVSVSRAIDVMDYISVDINGIPYTYIPKEDSPYTVSELVYKFNGIRKHSEGRALAWLKKYAIGKKEER